MSNYAEFTTLPAYEQAVFVNRKAIPSSTGLPRWSGTNPPPALGLFVDVRTNGVGPAEVVGYFVEIGWLGLLVKPLSPPTWFIEQNGYNATGHVFGAEIAADTIPAPEVPGPTQEQLAALQRYATANGKHWKRELQITWQNDIDAETDGYPLRQVRNLHGSKWLNSRHNQIKPQMKK